MGRLDRDLHSLVQQERLLKSLQLDLARVRTFWGMRRVVERYLRENLVCQKAVSQLVEMRSVGEGGPVRSVNDAGTLAHVRG